MTRFRAGFAGQLLGAAMLLSVQPGPPPPGPVATADVAVGATPAPMPDPSVSEPAPVPDRGPGASVAPGFTQPGIGPQAGSQGFTPHSSYGDTFDKRFRPAPMLNLNVTLQ